jgi:SPP1 gp7 family putative phage head morphogenesis protein
LTALIEEMHDSVIYWISAAYRANEPEVIGLAEDRSPTAEIMKMIRSLGRRWRFRFTRLADDLADWFAQSVADRSDRALMAALKKSGFAVEFRLSRAQNDVLQATIEQNVALIRSIPEQYLRGVEGHVMRSVQSGRKLDDLVKTLREQYGASKRRAALISRDQNNKATASLTRVRAVEIGLTEAVWLHSAAGKRPRPSHVRMNGKKFEVAKGMWDSDERKWVQPGDLINCRCSSRSVVPGFS